MENIIRVLKNLPNDFLNIKQFNFPLNENICDKITYNLNYYHVNYSFLLFSLLFTSLLTDLTLFFVILMTALMWLFIYKNPSLLDQIPIEPNNLKLVGVFFLNVFLIILITGFFIFTIFGFSIFIILSHALLAQQQNFKDKVYSNTPDIFNRQTDEESRNFDGPSEIL